MKNFARKLWWALLALPLLLATPHAYANQVYSRFPSTTPEYATDYFFTVNVDDINGAGGHDWTWLENSTTGSPHGACKDRAALFGIGYTDTISNFPTGTIALKAYAFTNSSCTTGKDAGILRDTWDILAPTSTESTTTVATPEAKYTLVATLVIAGLLGADFVRRLFAGKFGKKLPFA